MYKIITLWYNSRRRSFSMRLKLDETFINILKSNPEKRFTGRDLAEKIFKKKPKESEEKRKRSKNISTNKELINQIASEIAAHYIRLKDEIKVHIKRTENYPREYYYSKKTDSEEIEESENQKDKVFSEHDLYPLVCKYLYDEKKIYARRINEKKSKNLRGAGGNKWLHPDIVGLKNISENYNPDTVKCMEKSLYERMSLYSFEVKKQINSSNVRECFFQTVANSSWANYAYLVAMEINSNAMEELEILCKSYKVGLILLNPKNLSESSFRIPVERKIKLDWSMIDRIVKENPDFRDYINLITEFYQTGKLKDRDWDIVKKKD